MDLQGQFAACLLGTVAGEIKLRAAKPRASGPEAWPASVAPGLLCVLESYIELGQLDVHELADRFSELYQYNPAALDRLEREACRRLAEGYNFERAAREAWDAASRQQRQSPGSLPRVLPAALLRYHDDARLLGESRLICGLTHAGESAKLACSTLSLAVAHLLMVGTDGLLEELLEFIAPRSEELAGSLREIRSLQPRDLSARPEPGSVLQTALWVALYCDSFAEAQPVLAGLPLTGPALSALCGALLGVRLGVDCLPTDWPGRESQQTRLESGALRLYDLAMQP